MAERSPLDLMLATIPPPKSGDRLEDVIKWADLYSSQLASHFNRLQKVLRLGRGIRPDALAVLGNQALTVTLLNSSSYGALLQASTGFAQNFISLQAPGATNKPVIIDPNGYIGAAGLAPTGNTVLVFQDTRSAYAGQLFGVNAAVTISGSSATGQPLGGVFEAANGSTAANTLESIGLSGVGRITAATCTGDMTGVRGQIRVSGNATRANADCFKALPVSGIANGTITTLRGFRYVHVNAATTMTNVVGHDCDAITGGTNRIGFRCLGIATGAPAVAYGFESLAHAVGALQRSFVGDNSIESRQQHVIVNTAGKSLVVRDTVDGNLYGLNTTLGVLNAPVNLGPGPIPA